MKKITAIITAILLICAVIVPVMMSANAESTPLTNLYNEDYYTVYGNTNATGAYSVDFDKTNKIITTSNNQTKSMVNYSQDMTEFDSSVVIQGNSSGQIWAGISFHVQPDNFTTGTFNSTGYSAYIVRRTSDLAKVEIQFRYCTDGSDKKTITTTMSTALPTDKDLKLCLDVSVDTTDATIKLFSADGNTQYGDTLTFKLDARDTYSNTGYYEKGAFALIGNGVNIFTELSVVSKAPMANIPEEEGSSSDTSSDTSSDSSSDTDSGSSDPLAEKYNLFGTDFDTDSNNYTTDAATAKGTLKSGSANDFNTEITLKLNSEAEAKGGIIFRATNVGDGNDNMQGYALILDTTKGADIKMFLYKYGPEEGSTINTYLGRFGEPISDTTISCIEGKEIVLNLNVSGEQVNAYFYDKANPSLKSATLTQSLSAATESSKDNGLYYSSGDIGFYVAGGHYINAIDGLVIKSAEDSDDSDSSSGSGSSSNTSSDAGSGSQDTTDPLKEKYNLFGTDFVTDTDNYTTASSTSRGILKTGSKDDFSTDVTVKLNENAETKTGIVFRVENIGTGNDNMKGYALILDTTKDDFIRMYLYKYGPTTGTENKYLGRISDYIKDENINLTAGKEIVLHLNVEGDKVEAYFYDKSNTSLKSATLSASLKSPTDSETSKPDQYPTADVYYETGDVGFFVASGYYVNAIDGLTLADPESTGDDSGDSSDDSGSGEKDPLKEKYDLFGNFSTDNSGYTTASSTSRGTLKSGSADDFSTDVTVKLDSAGETKTGIIFRASNLGVGNDNMQGYALILDTTKDDYIRMYLYKYGPMEGSATNAYLGRISNFVTDENISLTAGKEIVLHLNVKGEKVEAYFYDKSDKNIKSGTISADLKEATDSARDNGQYYSTGAIGFYVANGYYINALDGLVIKAAEDIDSAGDGSGDTNDPLKEKYDLYGNFQTDKDNFTTTTTTSRGTLKKGSANDFSTDVTVKLNSEGETKTGIIFRASNLGTGNDNMQGYALILDTTKDEFIRIFLYKYGKQAGSDKNEYLGRIGSFVTEKEMELTAGKEIGLHLNVSDNMAEAYIYDKTDPEIKSAVLSADLKSATDSARDNGTYYDTGLVGFYVANGFYINAIDGLVIGDAEEIGSLSDSNSSDPLSQKYNLYGDFTTDKENFTTANSIARGTLKSGSKDDFSTDVTVKLNDAAETKTGIIFRASNLGVGNDNMQGYALILDTTKDDSIRIFLYKYGPETGSEVNTYLGRIGGFITADNITLTAGKELGLHLNVNGDKVQAYIYDKEDPEIQSETLSVSLKNVTDSAKDNKTYYDTGLIGFYVAKGYYINAIDGLVIKKAEDIKDAASALNGGIPAVDNSKGSAATGDYSSVKNVTASNADIITADDLAAYSSDWDNYTFYSSSTTNKFTVNKNNLVSTSAGAKRAILDGVTVKGFHAAVTMKVTDEGTLRSGIVFRVNNIEKALDANGALGANNIEGYSAILYKTLGTTDSYARVVMCIYKYGVVDGKYMYLGTVASKASEIPLTGFEKTQEAAAGQELTLDVNVIGDQITVYFFNADKPELKSEALIADLNNETDVESNTPSLKGVYYESGAIGLTATNQAIFTDVEIGEPNYPSTDVGDLSDLDSYTIYGSGVSKEGDYFTSNSSGTKKMIVNNLTVSDFKASVDMKIDPNGNLKTGFFFRVNDVGNAADAQTGWAIVVTRNYATNGETNPNRIDIVLFKWGYYNGKLSYLGEVAREVYKSGASFMDGKMEGEELTFVVSVTGAGIDATLYQKSDPNNKPVTFSSNLKFAGSKEKGDVAYFESGGIGLYLGNSVSDPVNYNMVSNFHIDDGSGVEVKGTASSGNVNTILGIPVTGENVIVMIIAAVFIISAGVMIVAYTYNKRGKHIMGESVE